ncbi:hypothetical protein VN97_g7849 [Penicillium thymicola]|uniref:Secreted protein n=1 Tax=Penicillium thymicola TaxID=293382 RepID=A0AAI9TEV1_PENTH|nr:hypothetical protein VN97_g7849 [Penicillium thymicola]
MDGSPDLASHASFLSLLLIFSRQASSSNEYQLGLRAPFIIFVLTPSRCQHGFAPEHFALWVLCTLLNKTPIIVIQVLQFLPVQNKAPVTFRHKLGQKVHWDIGRYAPSQTCISGPRRISIVKITMYSPPS